MTEILSEIIENVGPIKRIGVVGMGYVGIPSAILFANSHKYEFVWGFQRNSCSSGYKIDLLNNGICPLKGEDIDLCEMVKRVKGKKKFICTSDFSKISEADAVTIAVQTPFKNKGDLVPDLKPLTEGLKIIGQYIKKGTLVVLESTVTPGTTSGIAKEILEKESGMKAGDDFALAHAPERVMVGCLIKNIRAHDRIVGGIDEVSTARAAELYEPVLTTGKVIKMDAVSAEVTKTAENTFRDLQIAAVNQLALYCEAMGINLYDVRGGIDSLKGDGITRAILYPGAGVGGHCLTKDTYHLERGLKLIGKEPDFPPDERSLFLTARSINNFMPCHMFNLTCDALKSCGKEIRNTKIAILGWSFIKNSDDARNTPSEVYYNLCKDSGAVISVHDPHVGFFPGVKIEKRMEDAINGSDAIAVFVDHDCYSDLNPHALKVICGKSRPVIVDGRNIILPDLFMETGFIYRGIGRGDKNNN